MKAHPYAELFPLLEGEALDALAADILDHGLRNPIVVFDGMILDGRNRSAACALVDAVPIYRTFEGTTAEALAFVWSENMHRRHLDDSQRAMAGARRANLKRGDNQHTAIAATSQGDAAVAADVSIDSIQRARSVLERGAPELIKAVDAGLVAVSAASKIADRPVEEQRKIVARVESGELASRAIFSCESVEWYTPAKYLVAARAVLGGIDLDPASSVSANEIVQAVKYFTQADDGLAREWHGRVWMNPPYGDDESAGTGTGTWCAKLLEEVSAGRTTAAIVLVNAVLERGWFRPLDAASAFCFTDHRIKFRSPTNDKAASPVSGSVFAYFGDDVAAFAKHFSSFGLVLVPAS